MKKLLLIATFCLFAVSPCVAQTTPANQSPEILQSNELNATVMQLYGEGKYDEALPLAKRALELREKVLGPNDETLIPLLVNLGEICRARKKFGDARSYQERALELGRKVFGEEDLRITRVLDRLAFVLYEQHDEKAGESMLAHSLAIKEKALGSDHHDVADAAFNLGEMYRLQHDYSKAEPFYQQAIRIEEKRADKNNPELVKALEGYADVLFGQDRMSDGTQVRKRIAEMLGQSGVIEGGILNGKALKLAQPIYPYAARAANAEGLVEVQVLIDERGKVIQAKAINARGLHPSLLAASEDAARSSRFTPTLMNGQPVRVNGTIVYRFYRQF